MADFLKYSLLLVASYSAIFRILPFLNVDDWVLGDNASFYVSLIFIAYIWHFIRQYPYYRNQVPRLVNYVTTIPRRHYTIGLEKSKGIPYRTEENMCIICYETITATHPTLTHRSCRHSFHSLCLKKWILRIGSPGFNCIICGENIMVSHAEMTNLKKSIEYDEMLQKLRHVQRSLDRELTKVEQVLKRWGDLQGVERSGALSKKLEQRLEKIRARTDGLSHLLDDLRRLHKDNAIGSR